VKVKIYGAGSIGNHLAHASRKLGWSVDICDVDSEALKRTKEEIYPSRYGEWDKEINLYLNSDAPIGGYDLIFIGTPPDYHLSLAINALDEKPKAILVEKPVCGPNLEDANKFYEKAKSMGVAAFVGYDHVVSLAAKKFVSSFKNSFGKLITLDVEFREHWGGIFSAHPWLDGPQDSYLGSSERGGGASSEHSHAANLWQYFSYELGGGRIIEVQAMLDIIKTDKLDYDQLCVMNFKTENNLIGRCVQDVVTSPPRKWARAQFKDANIELSVGYEPGLDKVISRTSTNENNEFDIKKTRPDDFIEELKHIESALSTNPDQSPINITHGLDTMLVVAAAHKSSLTGKTVKIDYSRGYTLDSLIID